MFSTVLWRSAWSGLALAFVRVVSSVRFFAAAGHAFLARAESAPPGSCSRLLPLRLAGLCGSASHLISLCGLCFG